MSGGRPWIVPAELIDRTIHRSRTTRVVAARIAGSPGVALFQGQALRLVLTADDARALADTVHDLLDRVDHA